MADKDENLKPTAEAMETTFTDPARTGTVATVTPLRVDSRSPLGTERTTSGDFCPEFQKRMGAGEIIGSGAGKEFRPDFKK